MVIVTFEDMAKEIRQAGFSIIDSCLRKENRVCEVWTLYLCMCLEIL